MAGPAERVNELAIECIARCYHVIGANFVDDGRCWDCGTELVAGDRVVANVQTHKPAGCGTNAP